MGLRGAISAVYPMCRHPAKTRTMTAIDRLRNRCPGPLSAERLVARTKRGFSDFARDLMVWGSVDVIRQYATFRNSTAGAQSPQDILWRFEDLIRAIRADLGHSNDGLERGNLLSLFVNDLPDYIPESADGSATPVKPSNPAVRSGDAGGAEK